MVRRHHVPGRQRRRGVPDDVLIHRHVPRPQRALGDVAHRKFPVLRRLIQSLEKAFALFLLRDVEKEFQDHRAVAREVALERGNVLEPLLPDVLGDQLRGDLLVGKNFRMHPRHQAFFIIGAVEDADAATLRQRNRAAPQEIMIEFVGGRLLERMDVATLRIDALEYALDRAVLTRRVHALKDQEHRPAVLRVEFFLKIVQAFPVGFENLFGLLLVETALLVGLVRFELELVRPVETKRRHEGFQLGRERWRRLLAHDGQYLS